MNHDQQIINIINSGLKQQTPRMLYLIKTYTKKYPSDTITKAFQKILEETDDFNFLVNQFNKKYYPHAEIDKYHLILFIEGEATDSPHSSEYQTTKEWIIAIEKI